MLRFHIESISINNLLLKKQKASYYLENTISNYGAKYSGIKN